MWKDFKRVIKKHHSFAITTHVNPDGDGIGSISALTEFLLQYKKNVRVLLDASIPPKFRFLDQHGLFEIYVPDNDYDDIEALIILDTHQKERIGHVRQLVKKSSRLTCAIDHHPLNNPFADYNIIDSEACSTGAMIYTLFEECEIKISINAATGIYTSIICDTGQFSNSATTELAHSIAKKCIQIGIDPTRINDQVFHKIPLAQIQKIARSLLNMETHHNNKIIIQEIHLDDYESDEIDVQDLEQMHHDLHRSVDEVECVVLLRELNNDRVKVSMRSKTDVDIGKIMKSVGGGGHPKAAGVSLSGSLKSVKRKILKLLSNTFYLF